MSRKTQAEIDQEAAEKFASERYDAQGHIESSMPWSDCKEAVLFGINFGRANPIQPVASKSDEERANDLLYKKFDFKIVSNTSVTLAYHQGVIDGMLDERGVNSDELAHIKKLERDRYETIVMLEAQLAKQESAVQGLVEAVEEAIDVLRKNFILLTKETLTKALRAYEESRASKGGV